MQSEQRANMVIFRKRQFQIQIKKRSGVKSVESHICAKRQYQVATCVAAEFLSIKFIKPF